jgi:hypothetical protein
LKVVLFYYITYVRSNFVSVNTVVNIEAEVMLIKLRYDQCNWVDVK